MVAEIQISEWGARNEEIARLTDPNQSIDTRVEMVLENNGCAVDLAGRVVTKSEIDVETATK